jgi:C1A family cysteine protease
MQTDLDGFLTTAGSNQGGHCVYLNGVNDKVRRNGKNVQAFRGMNSWGNTWGQKGRFWLAYDDLDRLIQDNGEAAALTEVRVK